MLCNHYAILYYVYPLWDKKRHMLLQSHSWDCTYVKCGLHTYIVLIQSAYAVFKTRFTVSEQWDECVKLQLWGGSSRVQCVTELVSSGPVHRIEWSSPLRCFSYNTTMPYYQTQGDLLTLLWLLSECCNIQLIVQSRHRWVEGVRALSAVISLEQQWIYTHTVHILCMCL